MSSKKIFATFLTDGSYLPGIIALERSLKAVRSTYPLVVFYIETVNKEDLSRIASFGIQLVPVERIIPPDSVKKQNQENGYARWNETFSKIEIFRQIQFERIVLLDADMMVVNNIDHLFLMPSMSAVAAGQALNPSWIQLNSGLMVIEPQIETYNKLRMCLESLSVQDLVDFEGLGDQDLVHLAFRDWPSKEDLHLPESYNLFAHYVNTYFKEGILSDKIYVLHFSRSPKPWQFKVKDWIPACIRMLRTGSAKELKWLLQYRALLK